MSAPCRSLPFRPSGDHRDLHSFPTRRSSDLAIADLALARAEHTPQRFYSMSAQIRQERSAYNHILEQTQDRKSTRLNSSHANISYAVFCFKKKTTEAYIQAVMFMLLNTVHTI